MPKQPVVRAWYDKGRDETYVKHGRHWYIHEYMLAPGDIVEESWSETVSTVAWMNMHCLELHEREARKLDRERREAK